MVRVGVYGCFATVLAGHFFTPHAGSRGGAGPLIATYPSFALAFFSRPALTELTATPTSPPTTPPEPAPSALADALRPLAVTEVIASGGGTRNPVLMAMLRAELLSRTALLTSDALGLPVAGKEAYAFAVLGFLTLHGLPGNAPRLHRRRGAARPRLPHPGPAPAGAAAPPATRPRRPGRRPAARGVTFRS